MSTVCDALLEQLLERMSRQDKRDFIEQKLKQVNQYITQGSIKYEQVNQDLLSVRQHLGSQILVASFVDRDTKVLPGHYGEVPIGHWKVNEAFKVLYLSLLVDSLEDSYLRLFEIYNQGDSECRVACLRALNFTTGIEKQGLDLIYDAGRTYLPDLLSAAWHHNPFSSHALSDTEYRKAVLKALFCEIPVEGFLRLNERADAELSRSLCEYANEREAAGRQVPLSIWTVAARFPLPGLVARLIGRLEHPNQEERLNAACALQSTADPRAESFLQERLSREQDINVQHALKDALAVL
jgi:hypothetical protein